MIFGPSDAEFHLELEDTKKCIHQKLPKQRDSNGRSVLNLPLAGFFKGHHLKKVVYQGIATIILRSGCRRQRKF